MREINIDDMVLNFRYLVHKYIHRDIHSTDYPYDSIYDERIEVWNKGKYWRSVFVCKESKKIHTFKRFN